MNKPHQRSGTVDSNPERDRELARLCLARISPECDRDTWVTVGMALRSVGADMSDDWHRWSSGSPQYRQREADRQWSSFKPDGGTAMGTLVRMAGLTKDELREVGGGAAPMPVRSKPKPQVKAVTSDTTETFGTFDEAVAAVLKGGFTEGGRWRYRDDWWQLRLNRGDEKQFRPISRTECGKWVVKAPDHRTLYRIEHLPADLDTVVLVVEGEKCADLGAALGFPTVTCANGSKSPHKSDWSPLKGRTVAVLPDKDKDGEQFADKVRGELAVLGCSVSVVELPGLEIGEDIEQWRERQGADAAVKLRDLVEGSRDQLPLPDSVEMLEESLVWCDQHQGRQFVGLPSGVLPKLDRMLDGFRGLTILAGAPGCGKTTLVLAASIGVANINPDTAVLFVSCEMSRRELMHRLLCMHSTTHTLDWRGLVKGQGMVVGTRAAAISEARDRLNTVLPRVTVLEQAELTRMAQPRGGDVFVLIRQAMRQLKRRTGCTKGMVVIDNMATLPVISEDFNDELDRDRVVSRRLMDLQELTGDAVLVIAQQNKDALRELGQSRTMAGVKGAVEIVYAADAVLLLTKFNGDLNARHAGLQHVRTCSTNAVPFPIIRCSMPKGRDGMTRSDLLMLFDHERSTLMELDRDMVVEQQPRKGDDEIPI